MNLEYICEQMVRILHGNITCISKSGAIEACYGDMAVQYNPLFTNSEFLSAVHNREKKDYPDLFYEKDTILYGVIPLESGEIQNETNNESKSGSRLDEKKHFAKIVVGPVSTEKHTKDSEHYLMQHHHISNETGFRLSFCELKVFGSGILMLYHMITGKELTINDLWQKNGIRETDIIEVKGQISSVIFEHQEQDLPHNPYDQELRELDSIRHGDVEMLNRSLAETYRGEVGQLAKNQVRQAKNIVICVIALASRAAISGGMIPEEAFSMVDGYIMKIEDMNNAVKIDSMMRQAEYEFAERVAEIHKNQHKNELVERTKNYIYQNLHSDIVIGEIGQKIGVNTSYLSDLFHKVEGTTIQQYIRKEKIRLAENMLRYSDYEVKEIASYLSFCSQSYFGNIFRQQTGMTPARYRKKYGKWKEQK